MDAKCRMPHSSLCKRRPAEFGAVFADENRCHDQKAAVRRYNRSSLRALFRVTVRELVTLLFAGCVLCSSPNSCFASTALSLSLEEITKYSGEIFAGTVIRIEYTRKTGAGILSRITFGSIQSAKTSGPSRSELTLTIAGGRIGNVVSAIEGLPQLDLGKRYVLFVDPDLGSPANSYDPILGLEQGVYTVQADNNGRPIVHDAKGRPLVKVVDGHSVVVDPTLASVTAETNLIRPQIASVRGPEDVKNGPKMPAGGQIVSVEIRQPSEAAEVDSLPPVVRKLGARQRDGSAYLVPPNLDPKVRLTETDFLDEIRNIASRR